MDDLETMLTLKFRLQKEQNCYSLLSTQASWIQTNKAFSRSRRKINSIAFVFYIATAEHGRAATLLQSRIMAQFILEQASFEKKHFVNQVVHDVPWWHEETIQELWILEFWFLSNYFFSSANNVSSVNVSKACSPWRKSNWNAKL